MLLFIAAWSVLLLFKQRDPVGSFIFQVRQYGDESSSFARTFFWAHLLDDRLVSLPKMTRDFMVRNGSTSCSFISMVSSKKHHGSWILDSGHISTDSWILKVDSWITLWAPFWEVFLPIFCWINMVENIGLQGADVPIAVVSSNFETNSSRHLGLGVGDTWWYGCWDFQALVKIGSDTGYEIVLWQRESTPLGKKLNLFFEDIRRWVQSRPFFQKNLKIEQDGHASWICSPYYPQIFMHMAQRFIKP